MQFPKSCCREQCHQFSYCLACPPRGGCRRMACRTLRAAVLSRPVSLAPPPTPCLLPPAPACMLRRRHGSSGGASSSSSRAAQPPWCWGPLAAARQSQGQQPPSPARLLRRALSRLPALPPPWPPARLLACWMASRSALSSRARPQPVSTAQRHHPTSSAVIPPPLPLIRALRCLLAC